MSQKIPILLLSCLLLLGAASAAAADLVFVLGGDDPGESAFVSDVTQRLGDLHAVKGDRIASVSAGAFRSGYALAKDDRQVASIDVRTRGHVMAPRPVTPLPPPASEPTSAFELLSDDHALLIPVGETALKAVFDADASESLLTVLITRSAFESLTAGLIPDTGNRQVAAIVTDQPLERQLALIATALPKAHRIGLLYPAAAKDRITALRRLAAQYRLRIEAQPLDTAAALSASLQPVLTASDALLVLPEVVASSAGTGQALLQAAARSGRPVIASSESLLRAGALVSVFTTREQFARQTAESIRHFEQGARLAMIEEPRYFEVRHNTSVAASLDLSLPDDAELTSSPGLDAGGRK